MLKKANGKRIAFFILGFFLLLLGTACGKKAAVEEPEKFQEEPEEATDAVFPYTFQDSLGETITLKEWPKKVAVLFSSYAEIWETAGGEVSVTVQEAVERGFAPASAILCDNGAGKTIDMEVLVDAEPDLVLGSSDLEAQVQTIKDLNQMGIPSAAFHVETPEDYLALLKIATEITGEKDAYQEGLHMQKEIEKLLESIPQSPAGEEPRILFIRSGSGVNSAKAKRPEDHFAAGMLEDLHTQNIATKAPVLLDGLSIETILMEDPDMIFISTMGEEEKAKAYMDSLLESKAWKKLKAVQEGKVYYLPKELFQFKPNGRWEEAYEYLAKILYPDLFLKEKSS